MDRSTGSLTGVLAIFGAGNDQLATYRTASRVGLTTIGFDVRPDAPGRVLADCFFPIDVRDIDGALAAMTGHDVIGLVSPAVDRGIPTARELAIHLGLPTPTSKRAAVCSVSKPAFRELIDELGLPTYPSVTLGPEVPVAGAQWALTRFDLPVIVKPVDSSGTKGVNLVTTVGELDDAVAEARIHASDDWVIVEQFVWGRHLSIEAFLDRGEVAVPVLAERVHTGPPTLATLANHVPPDIPAGSVEAIWADAQHIISALDLTEGPVIFDLVLTADGRPHFVEMSARIGGNGMPGLVEATMGVDTVRALIDQACGRRPDLTRTRDRAAAQLMLAAAVGGRVERVHVPDEVHHHPALAGLEILVQPGDQLRPYRRAPDTAGYALVAGEADLATTLRVAADLIRRIEVTVTTSDGATVPCTWRTP